MFKFFFKLKEIFFKKKKKFYIDVKKKDVFASCVERSRKYLFNKEETGVYLLYSSYFSGMLSKTILFFGDINIKKVEGINIRYFWVSNRYLDDFKKEVWKHCGHVIHTKTFIDELNILHTRKFAFLEYLTPYFLEILETAYKQNKGINDILADETCLLFLPKNAFYFFGLPEHNMFGFWLYKNLYEEPFVDLTIFDKNCKGFINVCVATTRFKVYDEKILKDVKNMFDTCKIYDSLCNGNPWSCKCSKCPWGWVKGLPVP